MSRASNGPIQKVGFSEQSAEGEHRVACAHCSTVVTGTILPEFIRKRHAHYREQHPEHFYKL